MEIIGNYRNIFILFLVIGGFVAASHKLFGFPVHKTPCSASLSSNRYADQDTFSPLLTEIFRKENITHHPYRSFSTYLPALDKQSVSQDCEFTTDSYDSFMGQNKRELKPEIFFSYSPDNIKAYLKNKALLVTTGRLTSISGGYKYLTLEFAILSRNAVAAFGGLRKGSLLRLYLLDGKTVTLYNTRASNPVFDQKTGTYTFTGIYPVDPSQEKQLIKSYIDKVRVVWQTGYEDYPVYNIGFLSHQFTCINQTGKNKR